ncbi:class I SAM-dependent methyltransferase [Methylacidiphilum caldifontis]|uniref:SAM-dependent methyltransferase n=1 Tax=Methylacidiphilum caldifontis TaxID=2795386 RepID=A0A4Y8PGV7_9BACT|nr:class I SAM-dependent methyltransferase [Methylacidiphilum caldifontis]TFE71317.1 SAM-dependent methyltransferase [Methylacidiphilum caldifontis]
MIFHFHPKKEVKIDFKNNRINFLFIPLFLFMCLDILRNSLFLDSLQTAVIYNKPYRFSRDTFTDRIPFWKQDLLEYKGKPHLSYLEIGVHEGRSALWMLENILTDPTSTLIVIDDFGEHSYGTFISNVNLSGEAYKFKILKGLSTEKIKEVPLNSIDIAYIDGSGRSDIMLADLINSWDRVKQGGLIICNRYRMTKHLRWALNAPPDDLGPVGAIDTFLDRYKSRLKVVRFMSNFVIVRKMSE